MGKTSILVNNTDWRCERAFGREEKPRPIRKIMDEMEESLMDSHTTLLDWQDAKFCIGLANHLISYIELKGLQMEQREYQETNEGSPQTC